MQYIIIVGVCAFCIVFWKEIYKLMYKCVNNLKESMKQLKPEEKTSSGTVSSSENGCTKANVITKVKTLSILGLSPLLSWIGIAFFALFLIKVSHISSGDGVTSIFSSYKEFTDAEVYKMNCEDLLKKNAGKRRYFCGYVGGGFITMYKKDLYNSQPKYCYNSMKLRDDEYCYILFGQYDNSRFYGYPEGMYSFSAELSSDCHYEYYNRDFKFADHCLKHPTKINPADNKTKAKLGVY